MPHDEWVVMLASLDINKVQVTRKWVDMQETANMPSLPFSHKYLLSLSKHSSKPYGKGDRHLKDNKLINIVMK